MRAARPFLLMVLMVAVLTGGVALVSYFGQDREEPDTGDCPSELVTVQVGDVAIALDDQGPAGRDPCDLTRLGPVPTEPYVSYDCRVVLPRGDVDTDVPERIEPIHAAGTCRQADPDPEATAPTPT